MDMFLAEGEDTLFRVGLALLKLTKKGALAYRCTPATFSYQAAVASFILHIDTDGLI